MERKVKQNQRDRMAGAPASFQGQSHNDKTSFHKIPTSKGPTTPQYTVGYGLRQVSQLQAYSNLQSREGGRANADGGEQLSQNYIVRTCSMVMVMEINR